MYFFFHLNFLNDFIFNLFLFYTIIHLLFLIAFYMESTYLAPLLVIFTSATALVFYIFSLFVSFVFFTFSFGYFLFYFVTISLTISLGVGFLVFLVCLGFSSISTSTSDSSFTFFCYLGPFLIVNLVTFLVGCITSSDIDDEISDESED